MCEMLELRGSKDTTSLEHFENERNSKPSLKYFQFNILFIQFNILDVAIWIHPLYFASLTVSVTKENRNIKSYQHWEIRCVRCVRVCVRAHLCICGHAYTWKEYQLRNEFWNQKGLRLHSHPITPSTICVILGKPLNLSKASNFIRKMRIIFPTLYRCCGN